MTNKLFDLTGKIALVTGGNGGIGLGIARGLAQAGATVAIAARNEDKLSVAVEDLRSSGSDVVGVTIDVSDEDSIKAVVAELVEGHSRLDILVNNAGTTIRKRPEEFDAVDWDLVQDVNLRGAFLCSREAYPHMVEQGGGKILNIGSMTSIFGLEWGAPYAASKGGIVQMSKSLAIAWAAQNIQVNAILPGWISTDMTAPIKETFPERHAQITSRIPDGRWGAPSDFAGIAVFLASSASDYVTGTAIPVDGGYSVF
jgi:2-deoxy-D-gluconate 3-dehydrogenase